MSPPAEVSLQMSKSPDNFNFDRISVGNSFPCFIIAEIGQNHQGNLENAKELIRLAKKCGVNCVKFQKSSLSHRFTAKTLQYPYESPNSFGPTYGEHRAHLEFSDEEFRELQNYAENVVQIHFTASAMDIPSANFLMSLNVPFLKIGSGDTNNFLLLDHIAQEKYPIILSTGMQNMSTVRKAHDFVRKHGTELVLLHCVSAYPTAPEDVNLRVLELYKKEFPEAVIGYSGHEIGINVALAAVALGAKVIEKHFTQEKSQKGTDHQCSLDPTEMATMVTGIREIERALGKPIKRILPAENPCHVKLGKSVVTSCSISAGKKIELSDLAVKVSRPMGLNPEQIFELIGLTVDSNIGGDEPVLIDELGHVVPSATIITSSEHSN